MADPERNAAARGALNALIERPQPHDLDVERAVLSAMLREPQHCIDETLERLGTSEVFYSHAHRIVYDAILELHNHKELKVDLVSLANTLLKSNRLEVIGGVAALAEIHNYVPTVVRLDSWCSIVRSYATLRRMIDICTESVNACYNPAAEVNELIEKIETDIYNVREAELRNSIIEIRDSVGAEVKALFDIANGLVEVGIPTGYSEVDKMTGGLKRGEMFVLAARPSIGKTCLALNVLRNIALPTRTRTPRKVAFFSLEMTAEQITRRMLCTEAELSESIFWSKGITRTAADRLGVAADVLTRSSIYVDPTAGLTLSELRAKARMMKYRNGIDVLAIDYLQLMRADRSYDNRQQEVAEISGGIKQLAKDLKIPVLVLAQLNRDVEKGAANAKPKLSHLRESGTIEQDADIVSFLHRNRDDAKTVQADEGVKAEWIIEKNRNGKIGEMELLFFPHRMEFKAASRYGSEDCPPDKRED